MATPALLPGMNLRLDTDFVPVVKVSALGAEEQREGALAALRHARGFLRTELARRLRTRVTPELVFELDRGAEHSQRISDLLESLHDDGRDESS